MPASTDQLNPTRLTVLRPDFTWSYFDPDNDTQSQYQIKVYKYGGILQLDSGVRNGNAKDWIPEADLPERVNMFIIVRVFDGYDWSDYSSPKFFHIETNRPPTGDFNWSPKPVYEGDQVTISHVIDDLDKDILSVEYVISDPDGGSKSYASSQPFPYGTGGPAFKAVKVGTYAVQLKVSDGKAPPILFARTSSSFRLLYLAKSAIRNYGTNAAKSITSARAVTRNHQEAIMSSGQGRNL